MINGILFSLYGIAAIAAIKFEPCIVPYKSCGSPRRFPFIKQLRKGFN
jgi:hypothetical protein